MAIRKKPISKVTTRVNDMLVLQMWLLFGSINKALYLYNTEIDVMPFATWSAIGSVVIFACLLFFLRYIPLIKTGKLLKGNEKEEEYEY